MSIPFNRPAFKSEPTDVTSVGLFILLDFLTGASIAETAHCYKLASVFEAEALLRRVLLRNGYEAKQRETHCGNRFAELQRILSMRGIHPFMSELHRLNAFVVLAEELHYGRAAKRLCMSQSPFSRLIMKLESEVGVALFIRNSRTVRLSPAGLEFLVEARAVLSQFEAAVTQARKRKDVEAEKTLRTQASV